MVHVTQLMVNKIDNISYSVVGFFSSRTIKKKLFRIKRKFVQSFLTENLLKKSGIQILESDENKKQKLEKETHSEKTKSRGKTTSKSK